MEGRKHGGKCDEIKKKVGKIQDRHHLCDQLQITEHTAYPIATKISRLDRASNVPCFSIVFEISLKTALFSQKCLDSCSPMWKDGRGARGRDEKSSL